MSRSRAMTEAAATRRARDLERVARRRRVAVVAIHGMGAPRESETLLEWAEPLIRRMEWLATESKPSPPEANLSAARSGLEPDGPVRSPLSFRSVRLAAGDDNAVEAVLRYRDWDQELVELDMRVSEARWSESFVAMGRGEVFTWGVGFVWRTVARLGWHFMSMLALPAWRTLYWMRGGSAIRFLAVVPLLVIGAAWTASTAVLWAALVGIALALTALLPVAGLILFIPVFASALEKIVETVVEFVGDVATWTRRPVRAAAMRDALRAALDSAQTWLDRGRGGERELVVVAHSEGAAIAAETLFNDQLGEERPTVDAFVSVGAAVTLLGSSRWDGSRAPAARKLVAGVSGQHVTFSPVEAWARGGPSRPRWYNFWASWDPFAAGPISTGVRARWTRWRAVYTTRPSFAPGPREYAVSNTGSPLTDHQSYSPNQVQVIDPLARLVMDLELPIEQSHWQAGRQAAEGEREARRMLEHVRAVRELALNRFLVVAWAASILLWNVSGDVLDWLRSAAIWGFSWLAEQAWLLGWSGLAAVLLAVGAGVLGLWLNQRLWRWYSGRLAWRGAADWRGRMWAGGLVLRGALLISLLVVVTPWVSGMLDQNARWAIPFAPIVLAAAAVVVLVAPYLVRVPRPLEARP